MYNFDRNIYHDSEIAMSLMDHARILKIVSFSETKFLSIYFPSSRILDKVLYITDIPGQSMKYRFKSRD